MRTSPLMTSTYWRSWVEEPSERWCLSRRRTQRRFTPLSLSARRRSSTRTRLSTPRRKRWSLSTSTTLSWSTWSTPSRLQRRFSSSCSSWEEVSCSSIWGTPNVSMSNGNFFPCFLFMLFIPFLKGPNSMPRKSCWLWDICIPKTLFTGTWNRKTSSWMISAIPVWLISEWPKSSRRMRLPCPSVGLRSISHRKSSLVRDMPKRLIGGVSESWCNFLFFVFLFFVCFSL